MAIGWMRLDDDFYRDEKFVALERNEGKSTCYDAIKVYCICHSKYGIIKRDDPIVWPWFEIEMGYKPDKLDKLLETLAKYKIISEDKLKIGWVTSNRLAKEGIKRKETEEKRSMAGIKSAEARANQSN